ncbi:MAG: OmpH family outer membrane protein [Gammaproteobacteria bacterium]
MKNLFKFNLLAAFLLSIPTFASDTSDGIFVVDIRQSLYATQAFSDAYKALQEDQDFASNMEEVQSLQTEIQDMAENLQKNRETLSPAEIAQIQKDAQDKAKDVEFLVGKIRQAEQELAEQTLLEKRPIIGKILDELIKAKQIKLLLQRNESIAFIDPALDLTDDLTLLLDVAASEANTQSE